MKKVHEEEGYREVVSPEDENTMRPLLLRRPNMNRRPEDRLEERRGPLTPDTKYIRTEDVS